MPDRISAQWDAGLHDREPFISRAREAAELSLPQLAPRYDGEVPTGEDYERRFSGRAGRGVTNLASKLTIGLFPPTAPFFKYEPNLRAFAAEAGLSQQSSESDIQAVADQVDELLLALSRRERAIESFLDSRGWRARAFYMFQNLQVSGNYCLRQNPDGSFMGYRLDQFQVERDGLDRPRIIRLREVVPKLALKALGMDGGVVDRLPPAPNRKDHVVLFTQAEVIEDNQKDRDARVWAVWQETNEGKPVGERKEIKDSDLPLIPVRLFQSDEHYGRSLFDMIQGEVEVVEGLTRSLVEDAAMAANGIWRIDPASGVDADDFLRKNAGEAVYAKDGQIGMVRSDKGQDLVVAANLRDAIDRELAGTFLSFLPRDAERVTAQEVAQITQELNEAFGGAFSLLANELQRPLVRLTEKRMVALADLDAFDEGEKLVTKKIVTGIDAIGRGRQDIAMTSLISDLNAGLGPEVTAELIKPGNYARTLAAQRGVDPEPLIRTDEEIDERRAEQLQADTIAQAAPQIAQQALQNEQQ